MKKTDWTYKEFVAFLLIQIALVDMKFTIEEKAIIRAKTGEGTYDKMMDIFNKMNDYQVYETILSYKEKYYPEEEQKNKLIKDIKDVLDADLEFTVMEKELLFFMNKIL